MSLLYRAFLRSVIIFGEIKNADCHIAFHVLFFSSSYIIFVECFKNNNQMRKITLKIEYIRPGRVMIFLEF